MNLIGTLKVNYRTLNWIVKRQKRVDHDGFYIQHTSIF